MKNFLLRIFTWWNGYTLGTKFYLWRKAKFVGEDEFGNAYYQEKKGVRRFVIYKNLADASFIPSSGWHAWMHYRSDTPPVEEAYKTKAWQLPHKANLTGTAQAYRPPGSALTPAGRPQVSGDYEAWRP